jgi:hypothetical protein
MDKENHGPSRLTLLLFIAGTLTPLAFAQDDNEHVQVGVFADYLRLSQG